MSSRDLLANLLEELRSSVLYIWRYAAIVLDKKRWIDELNTLLLDGAPFSALYKLSGRSKPKRRAGFQASKGDSIRQSPI